MSTFFDALGWIIAAALAIGIVEAESLELDENVRRAAHQRVIAMQLDMFADCLNGEIIATQDALIDCRVTPVIDLAYTEDQ